MEKTTNKKNIINIAKIIINQVILSDETTANYIAQLENQMEKTNEEIISIVAEKLATEYEITIEYLNDYIDTFTNQVRDILYELDCNNIKGIEDGVFDMAIERLLKEMEEIEEIENANAEINTILNTDKNNGITEEEAKKIADWILQNTCGCIWGMSSQDVINITK